MNILKSIEFYLNKGYLKTYAEAKVAQDIILSKIAKSNYKENITIKGGVVMFNISNERRRATIDIDIDFIRYSIDEKSIRNLFEKLNQINDGIKMIINGDIIPLNHQSYKGKRVKLTLIDNEKNSIDIKIDIGVHNSLNIKQEEFTFNFEIIEESLKLLVNSKEQIFVEKLISLLIHNIKTTRYKDIFDMYYLCEKTKMNKDIIVELICGYLKSSSLGFKNLEEIKSEIYYIFNNSNFRRNINNDKYNWTSESVIKVLNKVLEFINSLSEV